MKIIASPLLDALGMSIVEANRMLKTVSLQENLIQTDQKMRGRHKKIVDDTCYYGITVRCTHPNTFSVAFLPEVRQN